MRKGTYDYVPDLRMYLNVEGQSEFKDLLKEIQDESFKINDNVLKKEKIALYKKLEDQCYIDFKAFSQSVFNFEKQIFYEPVFMYFNVDRFYTFFVKSSGDVKRDIVTKFEYRYNRAYYNLREELLFIKGLKNKVALRNSKSKKTGLLYFIFTDFERRLKEFIEKIETKSSEEYLLEN